MSNIKILSDSTCDLSAELIQRYDIAILPLHVLLGDEEYDDGPGLSPDMIYKWSDKHDTTPKTSAPSIDHAIAAFKPHLAEGKEIIAFAISASMSASCQIMEMAAQELDADDRVFVINSQNLSTGIGLLVLEAAVMAQNGASSGEIIEHIKKMRPLVRASFVVDTLTYLHRGGRCSGLAALAGGVLRLHPRIAVKEGVMHPEKKYRGRSSHVIMNYVKDMEKDLLTAKKDRVFITHSGCEQAVIDEVRSYLESLQVFDEILITRAGGVISSHCGPGTLGVLFIAGEE